MHHYFMVQSRPDSIYREFDRDSFKSKFVKNIYAEMFNSSNSLV